MEPGQRAAEERGDHGHCLRRNRPLPAGEVLFPDGPEEVQPAVIVPGTGDSPQAQDGSVGPEHAALRDSGRATYVPCTDEEALDAFHRLARTEGIIPALESSHALARALDVDAELVLVCLSGRGDKDLEEVLARA